MEWKRMEWNGSAKVRLQEAKGKRETGGQVEGNRSGRQAGVRR